MKVTRTRNNYAILWSLSRLGLRASLGPAIKDEPTLIVLTDCLSFVFYCGHFEFLIHVCSKLCGVWNREFRSLGLANSWRIQSLTKNNEVTRNETSDLFLLYVSASWGNGNKK